jgi:hypothetical protein
VISTRLINRVNIPPPHGGEQASQCSNTRIVANHIGPWSNIRARIGRLCGCVCARESGETGRNG